MILWAVRSICRECSGKGSSDKGHASSLKSESAMGICRSQATVPGCKVIEEASSASLIFLVLCNAQSMETSIERAIWSPLNSSSTVFNQHDQTSSSERMILSGAMAHLSSGRYSRRVSINGGDASGFRHEMAQQGYQGTLIDVPSPLVTEYHHHVKHDGPYGLLPPLHGHP